VNRAIRFVTGMWQRNRRTSAPEIPGGDPESRLWVAGAGRGSPAFHESGERRREAEHSALVVSGSVRTARPDTVDVDAESWIVPPVIVGGELFGSNVGYELLVGYTRFWEFVGIAG